LPVLIKKGIQYRLEMDLKHPDVREIGRRIFPVMVSITVVQLYIALDRIFASTLPEGSIAALNFAFKVMQLPLTMFVLAVTTAIFPTMSEQAVRGQRRELGETMQFGLRLVALVTIPATVGLIVLREPIIRLLFERGAFSSEATALTASSLLFFSIGLFAYAMLEVVNRVFFALRDIRTPFRMAALALLLNVVFSFLLMPLFAHNGLALANSLAAIINIVLLTLALRRKLGGINGRYLLVGFSKIGGAALVMGLVSWLVSLAADRMLDLTATVNQVIQVGTAIGAGGLVYTLLILLLKIDEVNLLIDMVKKKLSRA